LGAAAGISFVLMIHEFAASLMVRSPTTQVLGSYLWDQWTRGSYPRVAVAALLMVVVTGLGLFVTRLISGTSKGR
jgi:iron(III) transport system permease protein